MRVVTLHAVHLAFENGMTLRQVEFGVNLKMTGKTRVRIATGIDDEPGRAARRNVPAARAVARFAAGLVPHASFRRVNASVSARRKLPRVVRVAIHAGLVAGEGGAFDHWSNDDGAFDR